MKKNMGSLDKNIRLVLGIVILIIGYMNDSWWGLIGLIPILTSTVSFCPLYAPFKISSIKSKE